MCLATQQLSKQLLAYEKQVCSTSYLWFTLQHLQRSLFKKHSFQKCLAHRIYLISCEGFCKMPRDVQHC